MSINGLFSGGLFPPNPIEKYLADFKQESPAPGADKLSAVKEDVVTLSEEGQKAAGQGVDPSQDSHASDDSGTKSPPASAGPTADTTA